MKAYLKDLHPFFGIKQNVRRGLFKDYLKEVGIPAKEDYPGIARDLYAQDEREFHYCAIELSEKYKRKYEPNDLKLFEYLITNNSWWDTVDTVNNQLVHPYFLKYPDQRGDVTWKWAKDQNMWLNRVAIICQLKMKDKIDKEVLYRNIIPHLGSNEFFHQKAIGWALRQMGKTFPEDVCLFVESHDLKPLSRREALKLIGK